MSEDDKTQLARVPRRAIRLKRDEAVRRLSRKLVRDCPWITPADGPLLRGFAQLERLAMEAYARLQEEGLLRADGTPHPLLSELTKLRRTQAGIGSQLGLSPRARAEVSGGRGGAPVDAAFDRIEKIHRERHGEEVDETRPES